MARKRSQPDNNEGEVSMSSMGVETLDETTISELLASSRQRGEYDRLILAFLESDDPGLLYSLTEGGFAGKKLQTVKTGFKSAADRIASGKVENVSAEVKQAARDIRIGSRGSDDENNGAVYVIKGNVQTAA